MEKLKTQVRAAGFHSQRREQKPRHMELGWESLFLVSVLGLSPQRALIRSRNEGEELRGLIVLLEKRDDQKGQWPKDITFGQEEVMNKGESNFNEKSRSP